MKPKRLFKKGDKVMFIGTEPAFNRADRLNKMQVYEVEAAYNSRLNTEILLIDHVHYPCNKDFILIEEAKPDETRR